MIKIEALTDEKGNILQELISDTGNGNVKDLAELLSKKTEDRNKNPIEKNQLRKFYDSFLKIFSSNADEEVKKIQLLMMKAQAEYSERRLKIKDFNEFLSNRTNIVIKFKGEDFKKNLHAFK